VSETVWRVLARKSAFPSSVVGFILAAIFLLPRIILDLADPPWFGFEPYIYGPLLVIIAILGIAGFILSVAKIREVAETKTLVGLLLSAATILTLVYTWMTYGNWVYF